MKRLANSKDCDEVEKFEKRKRGRPSKGHLLREEINKNVVAGTHLTLQLCFAKKTQQQEDIVTRGMFFML